MRVNVLDYGVGNLHSLVRALEAGGADVVVEESVERAVETDVLVLPGVGAFGAAAAALAPARPLLRARIASGLPVVGICLGMQLLFEASAEGEGEGLGVLPGRVRRLVARRVPHIGWAELEGAGELLISRAGLRVAYFAHGFVCDAADPADIAARARHEGDAFPAIVRRGRIAGTQFHPEKSSFAGVEFLRLLLEEVAG